MRLYFRWKLFVGFFGFAVVIAGLLVVWLLAEISDGRLLAGNPEAADHLRRTLPGFLYWALLVLACVSIPPALWIASRLNRPIRLLHDGMQEVARGRLDTTPILRLRTYDEFELLIDQFNAMVAGLRELVEKRTQLQIARSIQLGLLPKAAPAIEGFDLAGDSHPAEEVGGDYFDFLPMSGGRLGLVISDVVGHGIGPALVMTATRTCLRSLAVADDCGLEQIVERSNRVLHGSMPDNCFVTLALVQLDPSARLIRYLNCGHTTGYLLDSGGAIKAQIESTGPPLGWMAEYKVEGVPEHPLESGDTLILLTDGVTEAEASEDDFFGEERALEIVRANLHRPAAAIVAALHRATRDFCRSETLRDDTTSLVVKVIGVNGTGGSRVSPPSAT
jgi:serine phosphatase RsbU (regulator of sigma subunit)